MSNEAGRLCGSASGKTVADSSHADVEAGDTPAAAAHERQAAYRAAVSPERLTAALGTPQYQAGTCNGAPLLHAKELSGGVTAPRPIHGEGGRHD
ncbi:hypothetical protein GGE45_003927 [Rhizobium aethiopicum]|nr:hypothetical protein [Rhizobium aethiopicum]